MRYIGLLCEHRLGPYRGRSDARCGAGEVPMQVVETSAAGSQLLDVRFAVLHEHDSDCESQGLRDSAGCRRAIHAYCRSLGHELGFGPVENAEDEGMVVCTRARRVALSWAEMTQLSPECRADAQAGCQVAAPQACRASRARGGLFVPSKDDRPTVYCFGQELEWFDSDFGELSRHHALCTNADRALSGDCASAIHRLCRSRDAFSGFGPLQIWSGGLSVGCLRQ
jgi:hypothetical protein